MQLERLQSMDWQFNDNRKTNGSNALGIGERANSEGSGASDLNDRTDESIDPIEELLRDFTLAEKDELILEASIKEEESKNLHQYQVRSSSATNPSP